MCDVSVNEVIIGLGNDQAAVTWTNPDLLSNWLKGINFSEMLLNI